MWPSQQEIFGSFRCSRKLDLKLITAWTHEADKEELLDGQVLIEGGEVFFDGE
jgi:hypothetical protein